MIRILLINNSFNKEIDVPISFIKNKYSKNEYFLIKYGLKKFFDIDNFEIYYKNGKPFINIENVYISISHDRDLILCAFSDKLIGADIQFYKKNIKINSLLSIDENIDYKEAVDLFSKKESIVKLYGKSLKNINDYDINNYSFLTYKTKNYVINCVSEFDLNY